MRRSGPGHYGGIAPRLRGTHDTHSPPDRAGLFARLRAVRDVLGRSSTLCPNAERFSAGAQNKCHIPAGIDNGRLSLRREHINGGPAGDLILTVNVRPHAIFERSGTKVLLDMPVSFAQAALGAEIEVPTLDGRVKYTMPAGTQTGTVFRLRGKGIPELNSKTRGDQFVTVYIEVPRNLTARQKELLKEFEGTFESSENRGTGEGRIKGKRTKK